MSKAQGKDRGLFGDLANLDLAEELESRLHDLERNIAVARQFIKLADESYSAVRQKWTLIRQDIRPRNPTTTQLHKTGPGRKPRRRQPRSSFNFREKPQAQPFVPVEHVSTGVLNKIDSGMHREKVVAPTIGDSVHPFETHDSGDSRLHLRSLKPRPKG